MKIVLIHWADAHCGPSGWLDLDEYQDPDEAIVSTVGYLVEEGQPGSKPHHVTIWQTITDGEGIHPFHIPNQMIRKMDILNIVTDALG